MNTNNMTHEQISAFADGETADVHIETIMAALNSPEGRAGWIAYHEIGDAVRSEDLNFNFSADFSARMSARLDAEPAILAPLRRPTAFEGETISKEVNKVLGPRRGFSFKRFALPTMGAAATAVAIGFVAAPQLMVASKNNPSSASTMIASVQDSGNGLKTISLASQKNLVMRDPRIDDYLLAHQRFSPSLYSTAQYARSATFATDTDK